MTEPEQKLGRDLLEEAAAKARHILEKAEREAAALAAAGEARRLQRRQDCEADADRAAADQVRVLRAKRENERRRQALLEAEETIQSVLAAAEQKIVDASDADRLLFLEACVREAAAAIGPGDLVIRVAPRDRVLAGETRLTNWARQANAPAGATGSVTLANDARIGAGALVETPDGRRRFDNTLEARRFRLDKSLRLRVAQALDKETPSA